MGADYRKAHRSTISFGTPLSVAVATTVYFRTAFNNNPDRISVAVPFAGVLMRLFCHCFLAPGIGETYTYTVYVNGIATAITCQTAGAVQTDSNDVVNAVAVIPGDRVDIEIVTSAGATVAYHSAGLGYTT